MPVLEKEKAGTSCLKLGGSETLFTGDVQQQELRSWLLDLGRVPSVHHPAPHSISGSK